MRITSILPEHNFLLFGIIFGLIFIFLTPPFQVPDELLHFHRSYMVSEGQLQPVRMQGVTGAVVPVSVQTTLGEYAGIPFHPEKKVDRKKTFELLRLPLNKKDKTIAGPITSFIILPYLPQALGISIGKILNLSPLLLMYLGRIFNFALWLTLIYLAIRKTPIFKWVFCLLALMPMSLYLAASLSYDALTNGLSFFLIALSLHYAFGREANLHDKEIGSFWVVSLLLAFSKYVYFPIALLYFLIPPKKFASKAKYFLGIFLVFFLNTALLAAWFFLSLLPKASSRPGVSMSGQLNYIASHLLEFGRMVLKAFADQGGEYLRHFLGVLGWLDTPLPLPLMIFLGAILITFALYDKNKQVILKYTDKLIIGFALVSSMMLIFAAAYLGWNPVGAETISGIQGRYFIPIAPLFLLLLYNHKLWPAMGDKGLGIAAILCLPLALALTTVVILLRYYF